MAKHDIKIRATKKHKKAYQSIPKTMRKLEKLNKQRLLTILQDYWKRKNLTEHLRKQFVQRITKNFLDMLILRLIQTEPMWGYKIIKKTERLFGIKLGHGALYPLLNLLEAKGYVRSKKATAGGRVRKVYEITQKGTQLVDAYKEVLRKQLQKLDLEKEPQNVS